MVQVASANTEAVEAWNGVLFDRFARFRHILTAGLGAHSDEALRVHPPEPGDRVLDLGCGFGDTAQQLAAIVGPEGEVVGIDASDRFIEAAEAEAEEAGVSNVSFVVGDLEVAELEPQGFDYVFSRMGTMFFANPVGALRNVRRSMVPGGRMVNVVWRQKIDNAWMYEAEQVVETFVTEDEESDEPTCGPGPFSMANADTTSHILLNAGFDEVALRRCDKPYRMGADLEEAIDAVMAIGPAGEVLRLAGDEAKRLEGEIRDALREAFAGHVQDDGVWTTMSSWIVTARVPEAR
jgi:ubiquinone/menaquinone biosynthesis C-methylase UbiE